MAVLRFRLDNLSDYQLFLRAKMLPQARIVGRTAIVPDEYAGMLGLPSASVNPSGYRPKDWMFDYQRDITALAIRKQKYSVFMDCGLGKTPILLDFAYHAYSNLPANRKTLIVSPLMVVHQTVDEAKRFYGEDFPIRKIRAADLKPWMHEGGDGGIGITNYDAITDGIPDGKLGALILDESSMLKNHYGRWGTRLIQLSRGLMWKLALTGTPAPNDRIEFANHAVFCDAFPNVNSFLSRFFVNRGQTDNRWELKPHALNAFYQALAHWSIFVTDPATYGWQDNCQTIPPINVHVREVELTPEQEEAVRVIESATDSRSKAGIVRRSALSQIAKGNFRGRSIPTRKPQYIRDLIDSFGDASSIVWCLYNQEQDAISAVLPGSADIRGQTPEEARRRMIREFQNGTRKQLVSKPKVLGFGLNLQRARHHVFSGLQDSYESFYQAVKRSNRYGSTEPLDVHIPVTEIERPMIETVLKKADRVAADAREQEQIFRRNFNVVAN